MINLPLFSQRDSKWASKKLGTGTITIGTAGCLLTCLAMVAKYYGKDTDPDRMNQSLIGVNGFAQQNLYIWGSINKVYGDISEPKRVPTPNPLTSAQFAEIDAELAAGRPVIIEVDFVPSTASVDMHFVVLTGKDSNGNYIVADPWYGDSGANLGRYGVPAKTIQQYTFTFGPLPTQPVDNPSPDQGVALKLITDAFNTLADEDPLKKGNLEGFVRAILGDHQNIGGLLSQSQQLTGFIEKWKLEWGLTTDASLVDVETQMAKLIPLEDSYEALREAAEGTVGVFADDKSLIVALKNEKTDKQGLIDQLEKYTTSNGKKLVNSFVVGKFVIKVYK